MLLAGLLLSACGSSSAPTSGADATSSGGVTSIDRRCDAAPFPSAEWTACEQQNFAKTGEAAAEESDPAFQQRWNMQSLANQTSWTLRATEDPSWLSPQSGNSLTLPLCATWALQCAGDPFRYAEDDSGPDGAAFYTAEADVTPVVFYDDGCARLSGRIWKPKNASGPLPGIVIQNGSVQAPETLYWWAAQMLVRAGYVVMTFDPRGQGRSDQQTPSGAQGSNANQVVFWTGLVNAIDFFRSTSVRPYPHNATCAGTYPTVVTAFNPYVSAIDFSRLGIAGHSLGGIGVSVVQAYGAAGADPWPGLMDTQNPVTTAVAWDGIYTTASGAAGNAGGNTVSATPPGTPPPTVVPRAPILGINGEYGLSPQPFTAPPDPAKTTTNFRVWRDAGVPAVEMTIQGGTHFEFSLLPTFPATAWCSDPASGHCDGGWGNALAQHYTLAWFDRWLKQPGENGYDNADARLLDDAGVNGANKMSYRYRSARAFPTRSGALQSCDDIRGGCP